MESMIYEKPMKLQDWLKVSQTKPIYCFETYYYNGALQVAPLQEGEMATKTLQQALSSPLAHMVHCFSDLQTAMDKHFDLYMKSQEQKRVNNKKHF